MRPKLFSAVGFDGKRGGVIGQSKRQMQCESKYGLITGGLLFLLGPARLAGPAFTGDQWGRVLHASLFWADFLQSRCRQTPPMQPFLQAVQCICSVTASSFSGGTGVLSLELHRPARIGNVASDTPRRVPSSRSAKASPIFWYF